MPQTEHNLTYTRPGKITRSIGVGPGLKPTVKVAFRELLTDIVLFYTLLVMVLKSLLFLGLVNNNNTAQFSLLKAMNSFSSPPPLLVFAGMSAVVLSFSYLFKGRGRYWYLVISNFLFSFLILADLWYYRGFSNFLSMHVLKQSSNLDNLSSSILSMFRPIDILFFIDTFLLLGIGLVRKTFYAEARRNIIVFLLLFILPMSYVYYEHYVLDIKGKGEKGRLFFTSWAVNETMTTLSPLGYHLFDLYNYWQDSKPYTPTPEQEKDIKAWYAQKQENLPPNKYYGLFKGQNLLILQVESLENFVINQKVNNQEITPHLNRLLKNSLYFPNFYEQVYNGTSSDADLMTNTSVYPIRRGSTFFRFPYNTYNSLPKLLEGLGYSTVAIHPDKGSYWNWMPALKSIGFQKTIDAASFAQDELIGLGLSDGSYFRQVIPMIEKLKHPFYTFMVTLSSHSPFDLPEKYRSLRLVQELDQSKLGGYFQSVHYTDQQIGQFLDALDQKKLLDNTVVVIYGDHTGVHKFYNDEVKALPSPESWWLDDSKRIPLIIYHKGMEGQTIQTTGGQIDTLPTVAYLMGVDPKNYENTAIGRNLLNTKKDFAVLANREVVGNIPAEEREFVSRGIDISDILIRSNYFKTHNPAN